MIDFPLILQKNQLVSYVKEGIPIAKVSMVYEGFKLARELLYEIVDKTTVLYVSGGQTPKDLYRNVANDQKIHPGAVALIDERYGIRGHNVSNEKMIEESGFLPYLKEKGVPFYPILQDNHPNLVETADNYDMTIKYLFAGFPRSVGILGIGLDGHTAGIAGNRTDPSMGSGLLFHNPMFDQEQKNSLVSSFSDLQGKFKERVSMTFRGLSMIDVFIVLVFGEDKKEALEKVFSDGSEEDIPGRFFKRPEIAKRTLLITDQKI
ncbi:MAG: 6-phosphogluconolactonase [Candidatus Levybacteria bacterium]|nr:6-phosphogluconolactonase [Candidatus Levybacteria bacterium]